MIDEVEKQGEMETIIKKACELNEEAHLDFGRGGKRGFQAFINRTRENAEEDQKGGKLPTKFKGAVRCLRKCFKCP